MIPDNYDQWEAEERKKEAWLRKRPVCSHCGKHIQDERIWDINGELYHPDCAESEFCKWTEDYEE